MNEEFAIDKFRDIASWMAEVERRLNALEGRIERASRYTPQ